jgi:hypothetical protein
VTPAAYLEAARVPATVPTGRFGLWTIERLKSPPPALCLAAGEPPVGWDTYTVLRRVTMENLHQDGEVVMEDSRRELRRHLPIWLAAHGRVLVSGLGLGCVVRGLLASPRVEHVDVVEIDGHIIDAIGPEFVGDPRVAIHHGDALTFEWPSGAGWDAAWHDIHSDDGFGRLQVLHAELMVRYQRRVGRQGAWMFPRFAKRRMPKALG